MCAHVICIVYIVICVCVACIHFYAFTSAYSHNCFKFECVTFVRGRVHVQGKMVASF